MNINPNASIVLSCDNVSHRYWQGENVVNVLSSLSLQVEKGERVAIMGTSGSGKTTLLNLLGGLDDPTAGTVRVMDKEIAPMNESQRAQWRNKHLGFVYQFHHLLNEFSALENTAMPLLIAGKKTADAKQAAMDILAKVGLEKRCDHKPGALSGGERQRVAIARALVTNPACVLMDEPTGNLDPNTAQTVLELLLALNSSLNISFVVVTHAPTVAESMDRVLMLRDGGLHPPRSQVISSTDHPTENSGVS